MIAKIIYNAIFIIASGILQASFLSGLPGPANKLNLVLVVLIFILGFAGFDFAVWWSVGAGFLLEIFSFLPFGAYLISLSLTIIIANWLLNYFFTNRSLYSFLALTALATIIYELIISTIAWMFMEIYQSAPVMGGDFWLSLLEQIGVNLVLAFFIFYVIYFLGRNLRPVFLVHPVK